MALGCVGEAAVASRSSATTRHAGAMPAIRRTGPAGAAYDARVRAACRGAGASAGGGGWRPGHPAQRSTGGQLGPGPLGPSRRTGPCAENTVWDLRGQQSGLVGTRCVGAAPGPALVPGAEMIRSMPCLRERERRSHRSAALTHPGPPGWPIMAEQMESPSSGNKVRRRFPLSSPRPNPLFRSRRSSRCCWARRPLHSFSLPAGSLLFPRHLFFHAHLLSCTLASYELLLTFTPIFVRHPRSLVDSLFSCNCTESSDQALARQLRTVKPLTTVLYLTSDPNIELSMAWLGSSTTGI